MIIVRLLIQTVFLALGQIWSNKIRSLLTTLGIIIGVAAVGSTVAAVNGLREYVLGQFASFGAKKVFIDGTLPRSQWHTGRWREVQLTLREVRAIRKNCDAVARITPHFFGSYDVKYRERQVKDVQTTGIWPEWHEIEGRYVTYGRVFSSIDEEQRSNVCLVNDKGIEELALPKDPVGENLIIGGEKFRIVGVVETKELGLFGGRETSTEIFVPFSKAAAMNPNGWLNFAVAELTTPEKSEEVQAEVRFLLRKMRNLKPEEEDTFEVEVLQQFIDQFNSIARGIIAATGGIVAISLLVGGIGIMNIMLVSVSERTCEIGLRKAMGAQPLVILIQFLVEAVVLCLVGAALGLLLGQVMTLGIRMIPNAHLDQASIPVWAAVLAAGFSVATGIGFGMFPALKAARLDPIDALRHE